MRSPLNAALQETFVSQNDVDEITSDDVSLNVLREIQLVFDYSH